MLHCTLPIVSIPHLDPLLYLIVSITMILLVQLKVVGYVFKETIENIVNKPMLNK